MPPEHNMPTSTPEERQKICAYCNTPADPLAVKCENCGSALPMALPRSLPQPVARLVEAQSRWSMGKTALVSIFTSLILGVLFNIESLSPVFFGVLIGFWLLIILPSMVFVSAIMAARKDAGQIILNLILATGLWVLGVLLSVVAMVVY